MKVVFFTDRHRGSFRVMEDLYTATLNKLGIDVISEDTPFSDEVRRQKARQHAGQVVFHNTLGEGFIPLPGCRNIALPLHEWSRYPAKWVGLLNRFDQIWVSTNHIRQVLSESGVTVELQKVPPALNIETIPCKENWRAVRPFRFFSCGEAHFRKGHHLLMAGFMNAFPEEGEATLTIKTTPGCDWKSPRLDISIIAEEWPRSQMTSAYSEFDGYVTASLAEGLGLPVAEAVLAGVPVVANGWGGHADLLPTAGFVQVQHELVLQVYASRPEFFASDQRCAYSSPENLAHGLRTLVLMSAEERARLAEEASGHLQRDFGERTVLPLMEKALEAFA